MDFITTQIQDGSQKWRSPDTSETTLFWTIFQRVELDSKISKKRKFSEALRV